MKTLFPCGVRHYLPVTDLTGEDVRAVLELVGEANDAQSLDEFRAFLLPGLRRIVPAEFASYNEILDGGEVLAAIGEPMPPSEFMAAWSEHALTNPLIAMYTRTRDGRPYRFSDVVTQAELERLPVYTEFFRHIGVRFQIAFTLPSPPALVRGIALSRTRRDFSDRERAMLDLARPYLVQAYRNALLRGRLGRALDDLSAVLDHLEQPALVADPDGTVIYASAGAAPILALLGGGVGHGLPAALRGPRSRDGQPTLVALPDGPLLARAISPSGVADEVIVLERGGALEAAGLAGMGLSPRESAVLHEFAAGRTPTETAERLGISVRTVHKHTQHINAKLGTRDRAQAVATVLAAGTFERIPQPTD